MFPVVTTAAILLAGVITLFFGRRFYWLWFGLAAFLLASRVFDIALYTAYDKVRVLASLAGGLIAMLLVYLLRKRWLRGFLVAGAFFTGALLGLRLLSFFVHPASVRLILTTMGIAGAIGVFAAHGSANRTVMVLSALTGAMLVSTEISDLLLLGGPVFGPVFLHISYVVELLLVAALFSAGVIVQSRLPSAVDVNVLMTTNGISSPAGKKAQRPTWTTLLIAATVVALVFVGAAEVFEQLSAAASGDAPAYLHGGAPNLLPPARPTIQLEPGDRLMVLAPHPDDETLAASGMIVQAQAMGVPVQVVWLTSGDNNEFAYLQFRGAASLDPRVSMEAGYTRHQEALNAARQMGLSEKDLRFLGYPDFGTLQIWEKHWADTPPFRGMFTRVDRVPYDYARRPGTPYKGEAILTDLEVVLDEFQPTKVIVSHPGDRNPDHQALYLFTQVALWDLARDNRLKYPEVYVFLTHYGRWPQPRGLLPENALEPPAQLDDGERWRTLPLTPELVQRKLDILYQHKTQMNASREYLESFVRRNELFDIVPAVRLQRGSLGVVPMVTPAGTELPSHGFRSVRLDGNDLVFDMEFNVPLRRGARLSALIMGYRSDRTFGEMPKLDLKMSGSNYRLYDGTRELPRESLTVENDSQHGLVRVPLALLGNPERVFMTARYADSTEMQDPHVPWIVVELPPLGNTSASG